MSHITIGQSDGRNLKLDVDTLLTSRLLLQANSGGGKSWLLRRLAEQLYGHVQTIIIDPEGEFYTLREKYGYVLVGDGGETPCDVRSAAMLAERFLELKASAVCDLYEAFRSRPMDRRQWVRIFINALLDAPRSMWHPLIVIVDEAHKFCPQETPKAGNQSDREIIGGCKDAMIALSTTGRKRGFCPIWATQRLAKVDKDASAEMFNRMVGMTIEDVDVDRAADLMSVSREDKQEFRQSLRNLSPGQFYAFGRAITNERKLVTVGPVFTHHPSTGMAAKHETAPPMPDDVKKFLPQLADLPKEAEEKVRTMAGLQQEIRELKKQLKQRPTDPPRIIEKSSTADRATLRRLRQGLEQAMKIIANITAIGFDNSSVHPEDVRSALDKAATEITRLAEAGMSRRVRDFDNLKRSAESLLKKLEGLIAGEDIELNVSVTRNEPVTVRPVVLRSKQLTPSSNSNGNSSGLPVGERAVLIAVAQFGSIEREQLTVLTGYKRSSRDAYISRLVARDYINVAGRTLTPTQSGIDNLGTDYSPLPTGSALWDYWRNRLPEGELKIMTILVDRGQSVERSTLDDETGYKRSSRDAYLSRLMAKRLIEVPSSGMVSASSALFD